MFDPLKLIRPHLRDLVPYSSARDDYQGDDGIFLDANENPIGSITDQDWNRYPDPYQRKLKEKISEIKAVGTDQIFLGNGSDEPIDLLFRAFCEPGIDNVIINPPTYGMYKVSADINDVQTIEVLLSEDYELDDAGILDAVNTNTKMVFICSPNNPTGNDLSQDRIDKVIRNFKGIVVIDEAYIDFTNRESYISRLDEFPNLVVLQTFSKAWGLAGLRLGMAFGSAELLKIPNRIKAPYNLSGLTQETVLMALGNSHKKIEMVAQILKDRAELERDLKGLSIIHKVHPSDANFFLVELDKASKVYADLIHKKVIVRDRSKVVLCENALRITVGTREENKKLIDELRKLE